MSTLNEEIGQIKLISYKGIETQLIDDELCLKEMKQVDNVVCKNS